VIYLKAYAFTLIAFFAIDFVWLGIVARSFYRSQLGSLMSDDVNLLAAGGFYLFYVVGIVYFAVAPAIAEGSWMRAALNGALLGLVAYGTYDMTNLATIRGWPVAMSLVDLSWGAVLTCVSAILGFLLTRAFS
jgi:uncharacterized membrane protein